MMQMMNQGSGDTVSSHLPEHTRQNSEAAEPRTVFVVEDHPTIRRVLREFLGAEPDLTIVGEADSAEAALTALSELTPDLLTVDLSLPGMSGIELVKRLAEQRPELRCLVVTGHTDPLYRTAVAAAGAAGYVTKDDPNEVLAAVRTTLET